MRAQTRQHCLWCDQARSKRPLCLSVPSSPFSQFLSPPLLCGVQTLSAHGGHLLFSFLFILFPLSSLLSSSPLSPSCVSAQGRETRAASPRGSQRVLWTSLHSPFPPPPVLSSLLSRFLSSFPSPSPPLLSCPSPLSPASLLALPLSAPVPHTPPVSPFSALLTRDTTRRVCGEPRLETNTEQDRKLLTSIQQCKFAQFKSISSEIERTSTASARAL